MHQRFDQPLDMPAHVRLAAHAAQMRAVPTLSERLLWGCLRAGRAGAVFRRQVPLAGRYIADFVAQKERVVVEVDGGWHERRRELDARRDRVLGRMGYRVLHIEAELVERDIDAAVAAIQAALAVAAVPAASR
jgi:very-short-patch-repair endonuclease